MLFGPLVYGIFQRFKVSGTVALFREKIYPFGPFVPGVEEQDSRIAAVPVNMVQRLAANAPEVMPSGGE